MRFFLAFVFAVAAVSAEDYIDDIIYAPFDRNLSDHISDPDKYHFEWRILHKLTKKPHNEFFRFSLTEDQIKALNVEVYNITRTLIQEIHLPHRMSIMKFVRLTAQSYGVLGEYLFKLTHAVTFEELIKLTNVVLNDAFNTTEDPILHAVGNLWHRAAKVDQKELERVVYLWKTDMASGYNMNVPEDCVFYEDYEAASIVAASHQILHKIYPRLIKSVGLEDRLNPRLFEYSTDHDYDIIPSCRRELETDDDDDDDYDDDSYEAPTTYGTSKTHKIPRVGEHVESSSLPLPTVESSTLLKQTLKSSALLNSASWVKIFISILQIL